MILFLSLLALASAAAGSASPSSIPLPIASVDSGVIIGTTTTIPSSTAIVNKYLGIPFAAPPARFRPPEPVPSWSTPYDAAKWGPICLQDMDDASRKFYDTIDFPSPPGGESEDCLNLNVFAPASASPGSKAVIFWVCGGRFRNGGGAIPSYDASSLVANEDVVVVTINFRNNVFGFPAGEDIPLTERNLGLLDQRFALDWVRRNIAELGGNSSQVTIAGESSGGLGVDALIASPPDPLPFRSAIMESNQFSVKTSVAGGGQPEYGKSWQKLGELAGCPSDGVVECLRTFPALELQQIMQNSSLEFGPIPDGGRTWAETPRLDRLNSTEDISSIARVPVLIGNNPDEGNLFERGENDTRVWLEEQGLGNYTDAILDEYTLGENGMYTENDRIVLIVTDLKETCPNKYYAIDSVEAGIPAWRYFFNASFPNNEIFPGSGSYHGAEFPFVFGTYPKENATEFEIELSHAMQKAWAGFAKDPARGPGWDEIPTIGYLGDGVKAGMDDKGKQALTTVDSGVIDRRCHLFKGLYDRDTLPVPG